MKILLAVDNSKFSDAATKTVLQMARPQDTEVRVLHVIDTISPAIDAQNLGAIPVLLEVLEQERAGAKDLVARTAESLRAGGFKVSTIIEEGNPKAVILDSAAEWRADLIVLGSHGRKGLDRFMLGSVSDAVARHASCSVEIVKLPVT